jgi:hypothetical protein
MFSLAGLAPIWLVFEVLQLVVGERYLGVKHIQAGIDPRKAGPPERLAFVWSLLILLYWLWMLTLLYQRVGTAQIIALIGVSAVGYALRRNCGLKWVLVILTFEGAIRIGMLVSLTTLLWKNVI